MENRKTILNYKKPTNKQLADELNVSESAIKQYDKRKRDLMLKGLFFEKYLKDVAMQGYQPLQSYDKVLPPPKKD